jgi:hypothetical protein
VPKRWKWRPALVFIAAIGVPWLVPTAASAAKSDLAITTSVVASSGNDHTVRITLTNKGPDQAVGNQTGAPEGGPYVDLGFRILYVPIKSTVITEGPGCSPIGNNFRGCKVINRLFVGQKTSVDVKVRSTDPESALQGSYREAVAGSWTDPDFRNNYATVKLAASAPKLSGKKTQKLGNVIGVTVSCSGVCTAIATGTLSVPKLAKVYRLKRARRSIRAGGKVRLKLKLSKKARRAAKQALKRGKRVRAKLKVTVEGAAGNKTSKRRTIRLKLR